MEHSPSHLSGKGALIIGAEPATLQLCRDALESAGFSVDAVDSGVEAVAMARKDAPAIIFVDLQLSDVPGREAVKWLRANPALRATPIVVLAAKDESAADNLDGTGAALRKPLSPEAVRRKIAEVFRQSTHSRRDK